MADVGSVTVTGPTNAKSIGRISWFSVRSFEMARDELLKLWSAAGLDPQDFLAETRAPDAYKQACKVVEDQYTVDKVAGTITRYILRHEDGRPHVRHVVRERYHKGEEKPFAFDDVGRFIFDPANDTMRAVWHAATALADAEWDEVVAKVMTRYQTLLTSHNDIDVRLALTKCLRHWHCLLLRPTGGVYFIPKDFADEADKHANFLRSVGSEMWALNVTDDAAAMVRQKLDDHIAEAEHEMAGKLTEVAALPAEDKKKKQVESYVAAQQEYENEMAKMYGAFC